MPKHLDHQRVFSTMARLGAAMAVLACSTVVTASEATEFDIPASFKSRAEVRQELARVQRENPHLSRGQASEGDAFEQVRERISRTAVRAQAQLAGRSSQRDLFSGG